MSPLLASTGIGGAPETLLMLGVFLATALFYLTIYLGLDRKITYLFFFSFCLCGALSFSFLLSAFFLPFLATATLANLSLLYFFASFFEVTRSKAVGGFAIILFLIAGADVPYAVEQPKTVFFLVAWFANALTIMACSWIALRATKNKTVGGKLLKASESRRYSGRLLSVTTALIFVLDVALISESFLVSSLSISSALLIVAVTYTVFRDIRSHQAQLRSLKNKAIQLENEMLKKSIQPHFLLNTMTVLSEWIEQRPALAVKQIELLSREFRYITRVADKTAIPIQDEIDICRVHLDIFNAKQSRLFMLETKNIAPDTLIPPMIFHTLVENGLTHSHAEEGRFDIEQQESQHERTFIISAAPSTSQTTEGEGLGMAYVKSRLEQAFPGKWQVGSELAHDTWITTITLEK